MEKKFPGGLHNKLCCDSSLLGKKLKSIWITFQTNLNAYLDWWFLNEEHLILANTILWMISTLENIDPIDNVQLMYLSYWL